MADCKHDWELVDTPPDAPYKWYRCNTCKVFGYVRQLILRRYSKSKPVKPVLYRCSANKCKGAAVQRVPGRSTRGAFLWACAEHSGVKDA